RTTIPRADGYQKTRCGNKVRDVFAGRSTGVSEMASVLPQTYVYANNDPTGKFDLTGLAPTAAGPKEDCSNTDPRYDKAYPPCTEYQGANARCFCKCADNGLWSSLVRCCL